MCGSIEKKPLLLFQWGYNKQRNKLTVMALQPWIAEINVQ